MLTRVRSLMSDVSTFKAQQAALAATDGPNGAADLAGGGRNGSGSPTGRQPALVGAAWSEYQDGVAARALLQQWQARQQSGKGDGGVPTAFTPTQAARVQELLQELAALSADAGQAAGKPDAHLAIDLGVCSFDRTWGLQCKPSAAYDTLRQQLL